MGTDRQSLNRSQRVMLRERVKELGVSVTSVAGELGCSPSTLTRVWAGKLIQTIKIARLKKLVHILGLNLKDFQEQTEMQPLFDDVFVERAQSTLSQQLSELERELHLEPDTSRIEAIVGVRVYRRAAARREYRRVFTLR